MSETIAELQKQIQEVKAGRTKALRLSASFFALAENEKNEIIDQISQLEQFESLDLSLRHLTMLPDWLANLTNLTSLDLRGNNLTTLPNWLGKLTNLTELSLDNNNLTTLPDWLATMTNLTELDLRGNQIKRISSDILQLERLIRLDLSGNPIEEPPLAVIEQGLETIRNYFRQAAEQGLDPIYEAKLLIIGEPGAGKTSLAKKLQSRNYILKKEGEDEQEKSTEGIEVIEWYFPFEDGKQFRVNIWDFGGQ